ncbi:MAG: hypothetical protein QOE86_1616 [Solirubrobacteraceae bacterium]|jgi:uncharacterized membrane protein HdeD (DUF308 family)|nr:hypothetical protein [Solirubrobacteraceae bacterium]
MTTHGIPRGRVPTIGAWAFAAGVSPTELRRARNWLFAIGILALLAGVAAIAVPAIASVTISLLIGWILILVGIMMAAHLFSGQVPGHRGLYIADTVLTLLVGLYLVIFPLTGTLTLTFMLAAWFFASAALHLYGAWRVRSLPGAGLLAANGALALLLGIFIAADLPSSANWAIGLLVGVNLIFFGIRGLVAGSLLSRALR